MLQLVNTAIVYFDIRMIFLVSVFSVLNLECMNYENKPERKTSVGVQILRILKQLGLQYFLIGLVLYFCCSQDQLLIYASILFNKEPSENIGAYWYVLHTMFEYNIEFVRWLFLLLGLISSLMLAQFIQ